MRKVSLVFVVFLFCNSCAYSTNGLPISNGVPEIPCCGDEYQRHLQIQYLGVGGFLLRRGDDVLLTAPFFSNPSLIAVGLSTLGLWSLHSDPHLINALLPSVENAAAILVGHAHYDHLMDIPYIAQERAPRAHVYGSTTTKNILTAVLPAKRLVALDAVAAEPNGAPGQWQEVIRKRVRIMAVRSEHAPHFCFFGGYACIKLFQGSVLEPLDRLPRTVNGWKEGQTFAYLIDFLGPDGSIDFRIHYQDAASTPRFGFPPVFASPEQKRVDVAILCAPGYREVTDYPETLLRTIQPRLVVLAHWEDFFRPLTGDPSELRIVPGNTDPNEFIHRMKAVLPGDAQWAMPRPGAWVRLAPSP